MSFMKSLMGAAASVALVAGAAAADPALIYDLGGKFDKSFNESAFNGAERWAKETGGKYFEIEMQSEAQREQALRRFAEAGANPIITTGFAFSGPIGDVAGDYPDTTFVTVDGWVPDAPNVLIVSFTEHEGSYLVGMMAALKSIQHRWLYRRNGCSVDPQIRLWLCAGCQIRKPGRDDCV